MVEEYTTDEWMRQVCEQYRKTRSLQKTAEQMGVAYGKVRKVLITLGEYQTPFSIKVADLRQSGLSVSEIAIMLGVSEKRVTAFLPYEKSVYNAPDPTLDAKKSEKYRKRMKVAAQNIVSLKYGQKQPIKKKKESITRMNKKQGNVNKVLYPIRLHLELQIEYCEEDELRVLRKYADATETGTLTRDILIPSDMPLHNLHYAIQRLFGWQNSHLRCFQLEEQDYQRLTGGLVKGWMDLVGTLFQGLPEDEHDAFWDDEYTGGSFKVWLKKKYTGPYTYGGYVETHQVAVDSVLQFAKRYPTFDVKEPFFEYFERAKGKEVPASEPRHIIKEKAPVMELTLQELNDSIIIEDGTDKLLERLEVISVLASPKERLADAKDLGNKLIIPAYEKNRGDYCGDGEPEVFPVARKILYNYDYGDNWIVEITREDNCDDLLEIGVISEEELQAAKQMVVEKHKPVCIAKKGAYVVDDVGGMHGYADFISTIYEGDDPDERKETRNWAECLGWSSRKVSPGKML